jgi:hypothetical protein
MLPTRTYQPTLSLVYQDQPDDRLELSRLMAAAVISPTFCDLLLKDPDQAIRSGFQGEDFSFSSGERDLILSIRASSLADLASQLSRTFEENFPLRMTSSAQNTDRYIL